MKIWPHTCYPVGGTYDHYVIITYLLTHGKVRVRVLVSEGGCQVPVLTKLPLENAFIVP